MEVSAVVTNVTTPIQSQGETVKIDSTETTYEPDISAPIESSTPPPAADGGGPRGEVLNAMA